MRLDSRLLDNRSLKKKLTKSEFARRAQDIIGLLDADYMPFGDDAPGEQEARKAKGFEDPFFFFRTYLPHYFTCKFAPFHFELVEMLERRPDPGVGVVSPVAIAAPRDFAKTTITSFGYVLHQIVYRQRHFILLISDTADLAGDIAAYIYLELCYNERLRHDFGRLVRENWDSEDFVTMNDVRVKARGRQQRLRGLKHRQFRPDLVILDDIENDQNARNPDRVKDLLRWIKSAVYPAIEASGNMFIIGTLVHRNSGLYQICHSKAEPWRGWTRKIYRAIQDDGKSLWPDKFPLAVLEAQKQKMGTVAFSQEKQNIPDDDNALFRPEWISYYQPEELLEKHLTTVAWFDPSLDGTRRNDFKAIVTVAHCPEDQAFYVLDAYIKRSTLEQAVSAYVSLFKIYQFQVMAMEANLFQRVLLKELDAAAKEQDLVLPLRGIANYLNKEIRIAAISPLVERARIRFRQRHSSQDLLVEQLLQFPGPNDDGPDALEGAVRVLQSLTISAAASTQVVPIREYREQRLQGMQRREKRWRVGLN